MLLRCGLGMTLLGLTGAVILAGYYRAVVPRNVAASAELHGVHETPTCCASAATIKARPDAGEEYPTVTKWLDRDERRHIVFLDIGATNEQGTKVDLRQLIDRPTALSFIYTRCQNPRKCPLTASTMAQLQQDVRDSGLQGGVNLLLMTYDPEYDTPALLKEFGASHGLCFDAHTMMLRPDPENKSKLFDELNIAVNFNTREVSIHGLQLVLFDHQGRYVRTYHTIPWNKREVLDDLRRLVVESESSVSTRP